MKKETHPEYHMINVKMTDGTGGTEGIARPRGGVLTLFLRRFMVARSSYGQAALPASPYRQP